MAPQITPTQTPRTTRMDAVVRLALVAVLAVLVLLAVFAARPPRELTIETGPVGGSYHQNALKYQAILERRGITLRLKPNPNSLEIARNVANPQSGIDVGFVAQDVGSSHDAALFTAGQIEIQPLFIFASAELGRRSMLDDLRGRRIVMPPRESATSEAAVQILKLYDITPENSQFTFMPLADAVKALRKGRDFDAGAFMLTSENAVIRELAGDSSLHLIPVSEGKAISNQLPFLRAVTLPRGIYSIADAIPAANTPLVAAPVSVIVRRGLHPYLLYSLLEALSDTHRGPTFISGAGEFPSINGSQLAADPRAEIYYRTGIPWMYRDLPPMLASAIDRNQAWIFAIALVSGFYLAVRCSVAIVMLVWAPFRHRRAEPASVPTPEA